MQEYSLAPRSHFAHTHVGIFLPMLKQVEVIHCRAKGIGQTMYTHIVAAVDGSHHADRALKQAGMLAKMNNARLTLVHIVNLQDLAHLDADLNVAPLLHERMQQRGMNLLEQAQQLIQEQAEIDCQLHIGESWLGRRDMAGVLVKFANAQNADLIILGLHGQGGLLHKLMGNFVENVIRITTCPLLIVKSRPLSKNKELTVTVATGNRTVEP